MNTRRFTDRDGVEWRVEWRGGEIAMGVPLDLDLDEIPLPPRGLHFMSDADGFFLEMSYINPNDLTEPELQWRIDERDSVSVSTVTSGLSRPRA